MLATRQERLAFYRRNNHIAQFSSKRKHSAQFIFILCYTLLVRLSFFVLVTILLAFLRGDGKEGFLEEKP